MVKCNYYLLNRLVNKEFPGAYRQIATHLEGVEFTVEDVQQAFNAMVAKVEALSYIKSNLALHPLTAEIAKLNEERHQNLSSLRGRVVYAKKSPVAEDRKAAQTLHVWISRENSSFTSKNMNHQNDAVHRLEHDMKLNLEIGEALTTLGMMSTITEIVITSSQILDLTVTRRDEKRAATSKSAELRREAYNAMKAFVMAIEVAVVLKKGDDDIHFECLKLINDVVSDFYAKHQSRVTRQRNAAEKAKAETNPHASHVNDEQKGVNVMPMGGKLATASRSNAYGVQTPNDMDLQTDGAATNVAMKGALAMSKSVNSGETLGGNNEKANNSAASSNDTSKTEIGTLKNTPKEVEPAARHEGADKKDSMNQES